MKRQNVSKREMIQGMLLLLALVVLLSFAGASDMENQQAIADELALFHVVQR
jgi:hypothetical protein